MAIYRKLSFEEARQRAGAKMVVFNVRFVNEWTKLAKDTIVIPKGDPDYALWKFKYEEMLRLAALPLSVSGLSEDERTQTRELALASRWTPDRTMLIKELAR